MDKIVSSVKTWLVTEQSTVEGNFKGNFKAPTSVKDFFQKIWTTIKENPGRFMALVVSIPSTIIFGVLCPPLLLIFIPTHLGFSLLCLNVTLAKFRPSTVEENLAKGRECVGQVQDKANEVGEKVVNTGEAAVGRFSALFED
ncbi:MAG: hypothetical protein LBP65_02345 [Puniceicoccales bacterium]|nr:hypothetical protein [Puniceicoccales bacterium]